MTEEKMNQNQEGQSMDTQQKQKKAMNTKWIVIGAVLILLTVLSSVLAFILLNNSSDNDKDDTKDENTEEDSNQEEDKKVREEDENEEGNIDPEAVEGSSCSIFDENNVIVDRGVWVDGECEKVTIDPNTLDSEGLPIDPLADPNDEFESCALMDENGNADPTLGRGIFINGVCYPVIDEEVNYCTLVNENGEADPTLGRGVYIDGECMPITNEHGLSGVPEDDVEYCTLVNENGEADPTLGRGVYIDGECRPIGIQVD